MPPTPNNTLSGLVTAQRPDLTTGYDDSFRKALDASRAGVAKQFELALSDIAQREAGANQAVGMLPGQISTIYQQGQTGMQGLASNLDAAQAASGIRSFLPASAQLAPLQAASANDLAARQADVPLLQLAVQGQFNQQRGGLGQARLEAENALGVEERNYLLSLANEERSRQYQDYLRQDDRAYQGGLRAEDRATTLADRASDRAYNDRTRKEDKGFTSGESQKDRNLTVGENAKDRAQQITLADLERMSRSVSTSASQAAAQAMAQLQRQWEVQDREDSQRFQLRLADLERRTAAGSKADDSGLTTKEANTVRKSKAYKDVMESLRDTKKSKGGFLGFGKKTTGHSAARPEDVYKKVRSNPKLLKVLVADSPELAAYIAGTFGG